VPGVRHVKFLRDLENFESSLSLVQFLRRHRDPGIPYRRGQFPPGRDTSLIFFGTFSQCDTRVDKFVTNSANILSSKVNKQGSRVRIHIHPERAQPLPTYVQHTHSRKNTRRHLEYSYSTTDTTLLGAGECQGPDVALVIHFC